MEETETTPTNREITDEVSKHGYYWHPELGKLRPARWPVWQPVAGLLVLMTALAAIGAFFWLARGRILLADAERIASLQDQVAGVQGENGRLQARVQDADVQQADARTAELLKARDTLSDCQAAKMLLDEQMPGLKTQIDGLTDQNSQLQSQNEQLTAVVYQYQTALQQAKQQRNSTEALRILLALLK
jgi:hypothetical protein